MNLFAILNIIIAILFSYTKSETFSYYAGDPDYPGMCMYKDKLYPAGDIQLELRCIKLICSPKSWISGHSCPDSNSDLKDCFRGAPISIKDVFPECCKRKYTCRNSDKTEYTIVDF